jgi:hypothetical protein
VNGHAQVIEHHGLRLLHGEHARVVGQAKGSGDPALRVVVSRDDEHPDAFNSFKGTIDFGGGPLAATGTDWEDVYLASFTAAVAHRWSKRFGDQGSDTPRGITTDGSANLYVTVASEGPIDFGGGAKASAGWHDIFVVSFTTGGAYRWSRQFGGGLDDYGESVSVDGKGSMFVTGSFQDTVDFGAGPFTCPGFTAGFVVKLAP